jgi:L-aminopeptidase/D-esterase-like protein
MTDVPEAHARTPAGKLRARGAGIPFDGVPGVANAITDVPGVEVGYCTLIEGSGALVVGKGPIRTGVTAILPLGRRAAASAVWAGVSSLNGNGEMTAFPWIDEAGRCEGPITITNTHAVGTVRDAVIHWLRTQPSFRHPNDSAFWLPVTAETYDGELNDIDGRHVRSEHAVAALESAHAGRIEEGSVGGGTGMRCYQFKAGSGTASRRIVLGGQEYCVGAFVQANFGRRYMCTIAGIPIGPHFPAPAEQVTIEETGSLIVVIATDAPLLPHQLRRVARRPALAMARSGGVSAHYSGDLFLAFTTRNAQALREAERVAQVDYLPDQMLTGVFEATIQAADEAIVNSFVGTAAMDGRDGHHMEAFPVAAVQDLLRYHNRLRL